MENFEKQEGATMPKINWKKYITKLNVVSVIAMISVAIIGYQFKNSIYQKGLEQGKQEMNALMLQQIQQLYDMGQQINFKVGGKTIIFTPSK